MTLEQILPSLYRVPLKAVNAFVIDLGDDSLVLIDAGTPGDTKAILDVIGELGRRSADVRHILVTHCRADHAGGLAELKKATGARPRLHAPGGRRDGQGGQGSQAPHADARAAQQGRLLALPAKRP
jgi:glyoxylase-like metal-dependent hydrolase (beta-lactamase superfamily II)